MKPIHAPCSPPLRRTQRTKYTQRGMTLVELMVGITVGMLVVLAAIGTIIFTRASSIAVSSSSRLDQSTHMVISTLLWQIRQAGALNIKNSTTGVTFDTDAYKGLAGDFSVDRPIFFITGSDGAANGAGRSLTMSYSPISGNDFNCIGIGPVQLEGSPGTNVQIVNHIDIVGDMASANGASLRCGIQAGYFPVTRLPEGTAAATLDALVAGGRMETMLRGIREFDIRYLGQNGANTVRRTAAEVAAAGGWGSSTVAAVELCIHVQGDVEGHPQTALTKCDGTAGVYNDGRLHRVVRHVVQLRNAF